MAADGIILTPKDHARVGQVVKIVESMQVAAPDQWRPVESLTQLFENDESGETIPAYGVFVGDSLDVSGTRRTVKAKRPSTSNLYNGKRIYVNGPRAREHEKKGQTQQDRAGNVLVAYDTGTPAAGETWGPKPGQWTLSKGYPGFRCVGVVDASNKIMLAVREEPDWYLCKSDSSISKGSTGTVSIYTLSEADTTVNVTAKALGAAITSGKWCQFKPFKASTYDGLISPMEC